jgi:hypothetical protein
MTESIKYRVLRGINWKATKGAKDEKRAEPGDVLTAADLKGADIKNYLAKGAIEKVGD